MATTATSKTNNEKYKEWSFRVILVVLSVFLSSAFTVKVAEKQNIKTIESSLVDKVDKTEFKEHCKYQEQDRREQEDINTKLLIAIEGLSKSVESMNKSAEKLEKRLDKYDDNN